MEAKLYAIFSVTIKSGEKVRDEFLRHVFLNHICKANPIFEPHAISSKEPERNSPRLTNELFSYRTYEREDRARSYAIYQKWHKRFFIHECDMTGKAVYTLKEIKDACAIGKKTVNFKIDEVKDEFKKYFTEE